jgi:hypothetical protein
MDSMVLRRIEYGMIGRHVGLDEIKHDMRKERNQTRPTHICFRSFYPTSYIGRIESKTAAVTIPPACSLA